MFFSALIAFALLSSLSAIGVQSAAVPRAKSTAPQACTGTGGTGKCSPLLASTPEDQGVCNNVSGIQSLVFSNAEDECIGFQNADCKVGDGVAFEFFNLNSDELPSGIKSLSCN
ncbi:hypothetical protein B0H14DRAFT_2827212 [Mycena olivaceomarginata]|nr:hypothetical protein B0H14DRAFT_2827212 [Mycena olivaceomarginata]